MRMFQSEDTWLSFFKEQEKSGKSMADFCREKKMSFRKVYSKKCYLKKKYPEYFSGIQKFIEITNEDPKSPRLTSSSGVDGSVDIEFKNISSSLALELIGLVYR